MEPQSSTKYIQETARLILQAFQDFGIEAGQVLSYEKLFPYLDEKAKHHRDWLRDAEHALRDDAYVIPDPSGLQLTETGHKAVHNRQS